MKNKKAKKRKINKLSIAGAVFLFIAVGLFIFCLLFNSLYVTKDYKDDYVLSEFLSPCIQEEEFVSFLKAAKISYEQKKMHVYTVGNTIYNFNEKDYDYSYGTRYPSIEENSKATFAYVYDTLKDNKDSKLRTETFYEDGVKIELEYKNGQLLKFKETKVVPNIIKNVLCYIIPFSFVLGVFLWSIESESKEKKRKWFFKKEI